MVDFFYFGRLFSISLNFVDFSNFGRFLVFRLGFSILEDCLELVDFFMFVIFLSIFELFYFDLLFSIFVSNIYSTPPSPLDVASRLMRVWIMDT